MNEDARIAEIHQALDPVAHVEITGSAADEISVIVSKPVDIEKVDRALLEATHAEPLDRLERSANWFIRLLKRDKERSRDLHYEAVRIMDNYYEYRPQLRSR